MTENATDVPPEILLVWAEKMAERGYYVLPMLIREDGRKMPLVKWGTDASKDPNKIRDWPWEDATHVAVACEPSGLVVVDLDPYYDDDLEEGIEGHALLAEWESFATTNGEDRQEIIDPPWIITRSDGRHLLFRADPSRPMSNSVKDLTHCIDIRGIGGIVAAYEIFPPVEELPIVPDWLYELAKRDDHLLTPKAPPKDPEFGKGEAGTAYGLRALGDEVKALREAWDANAGTFNATLNKATYSIGQLVAGGQLQWDHSYERLRAELETLGVPSDQYKTLDSGFRSGYARPRTKEQAAVTDEAVQEMAGRWISTEALKRIPPPTWLIPGWLELNSVAQIYGEPGVGKSFVALDIASRVSRGLGWPEQSPALPRSHRVAYIVAEGVSGVAVRVAAWEELNRETGEMRFYPEALQIKSADWLIATQFLAEWGPSLIVVDTQARCTDGVEENSPKEMGEVYARVEQLQKATGSCVLLVHHTNKAGQSARGTNVMKAAITTEIMVRPSYGRIRVSCKKQKNASAPDDVYFNLTPVPSGRSVVPVMTVSVPADMGELVGKTNHKMMVRQYLETDLDQWKTTKDIQEATGINRTKLSTVLNEMTGANELIKTNLVQNDRRCSAYRLNPPVDPDS